MNSPQNLAKLKWRCRRGTKELDYLLEGYLEQQFSLAPAKEQSLFIELLDFQDSQLILFLLGGHQPPSEEMARFVAKISHHKNLSH